MDPVSHFVITILGPAQDRVAAKTNPLKQRLAQPFLTGAFVGADTHQIHRDAGFHAGLRQQGVHEFVAVDTRGFGFKDQPYCSIFARLIAHSIEQAKHLGFGLQLFGRQGLFASFDFWIGKIFDLFEHLLTRCAGR